MSDSLYVCWFLMGQTHAYAIISLCHLQPSLSVSSSFILLHISIDFSDYVVVIII